jgi:hypothetical protein
MEARTLARCCFENFFWSTALAKHQHEFVRQMEPDHAASRKRRARGRGRSVCPFSGDGAVTITLAQLGHLLEGVAHAAADLAAESRRMSVDNGALTHWACVTRTSVLAFLA